jgi:hypothetical protein
MMTFSQYLEEKKIMSAALAGIVGGVGLGMAGGITRQTPVSVVKSQQAQPAQPTQPVAKPIQQQKQPKLEISDKTEKFHQALKKKHGNEYDTIMDAAINNGISRNDHKNLALLFAIRKTENGGPGVEFGVLHPKAKGTDLRTQAGWAAATIMKNRGRHNEKKDGDFVSFLGSRYAPKNAENDPQSLNANWIKNATHHYNENMKALED